MHPCLLPNAEDAINFPLINNMIVIMTIVLYMILCIINLYINFEAHM